ncbi:hypothetical protein CDAR_415051 [Caerostris darwini]|uniref:Uncharacterized protein n=1 Tax=Caerostris darwini TaxID=1538125 RepID=A0AAV4TGA6_9ARAC|nr:hypothetical protein CDAR_415051 [Caerostris darwini]
MAVIEEDAVISTLLPQFFRTTTFYCINARPPYLFFRRTHDHMTKTCNLTVTQKFQFAVLHNNHNRYPSTYLIEPSELHSIEIPIITDNAITKPNDPDVLL